MKFIFLAILFFAYSSFAQIQEVNLFTEKKDVSTIEKSLVKFIKTNKLPGVTFALANKGKIVYAKSFGYGYVEKKVPLLPKHRMRISGCSQVITTALIMKLLQENKLNLEDTVFGPGSIFAKEVPVVDDKTAKVRIRHLLEQSAGKGWADIASSYEPTRFLKGKDHFANINNALKNLREYKGPGHTIHRSSFSYYILGRVIEKLSGQTYLEYIKESFKDSLKSDVSLMHESNDKDLAIHYDDKRKIKRVDGASYYDSSWGVVCSPVDYMNILLAIDGNPAEKDVLIPAAIKIMQTPHATNPNWGKGWLIKDNGDIWQDWFTSNSAISFKMRKDGITWVMATNGDSKRGSFRDDLMDVPEDIIKKLKSIP